ncbi:hypothetical protein SV7mr_12480 [Stieleria bergensis]|uniref:Uncharacterized protein n=1 Tax=Stieleria bergensis TaxID=2528025 RepID=A0A517SRL5_9BACT|nr:hypothetical protein SV7mr_12480 [Planctomycetes bacterium SV_7m_r]
MSAENDESTERAGEAIGIATNASSSGTQKGVATYCNLRTLVAGDGCSAEQKSFGESQTGHPGIAALLEIDEFDAWHPSRLASHGKDHGDWLTGRRECNPVGKVAHVCRLPSSTAPSDR